MCLYLEIQKDRYIFIFFYCNLAFGNLITAKYSNKNAHHVARIPSIPANMSASICRRVRRVGDDLASGSKRLGSMHSKFNRHNVNMCCCAILVVVVVVVNVAVGSRGISLQCWQRAALCQHAGYLKKFIEHFNSFL